tara:strand:+ start:1454 stop:2473 length:1020 start_codon:yes stop_codon:yes gene_type:complete
MEPPPPAAFDLGFAGCSIRSSPFHAGRLAVAAAANFGIVGNGKLAVLAAGPAGLQPECELATNDGLYDCAWSETHEHQIIGACGDGSVKLWDLHAQSDGRPLASVQEHTAEASGVDWNLVRKDCFASCSWDNTVRVWDPERMAPLMTLAEHTFCVYECKWAPRNAERLLSASGDRTVKLWEPRAGPNALLTVVAGEQEILSVDWNKYDENCFATGGVDKTVRLWDLRAPHTPVQSLAAHTFAVRRVRFCPHSASQLLSASYDMSVCLWDVVTTQATQRPLRQYNHHTEFVVGLEWSLFDEGVVASCGWDNWLHVWHRETQPQQQPRSVGAGGGRVGGPV